MRTAEGHAIDAASAARPRALCVLAAVLALWFNLLVPPGFMLARSVEGATRIVICTGGGPLRMVMDGGSSAHRHDRQPGEGVQHSCPYAAHAAPALGPAPLPALDARPLLEAGMVLALPFASFPGRGLAAPPPPSHAPPAPAV